VIEPLYLSLREVVSKFGKDVGLNIRAVQIYARDLVVALRHLQKKGVVHADFKPDNILMAENRGCVKLCDFGTAFLQKDMKINADVGSRFYRPPEAILGLPITAATDTWSLGVVLFELVFFFSFFFNSYFFFFFLFSLSLSLSLSLFIFPFYLLLSFSIQVVYYFQEPITMRC
jgi:serine/threonine protein kinase